MGQYNMGVTQAGVAIPVEIIPGRRVKCIRYKLNPWSHRNASELCIVVLYAVFNRMHCITDNQNTGIYGIQ